MKCRYNQGVQHMKLERKSGGKKQQINVSIFENPLLRPM
jgi:hypothetical protein